MIDLSKILQYAPYSLELYSKEHGKVYFTEYSRSSSFPITVAKGLSIFDETYFYDSNGIKLGSLINTVYPYTDLYPDSNLTWNNWQYILFCKSVNSFIKHKIRSTIYYLASETEAVNEALEVVKISSIEDLINYIYVNPSECDFKHRYEVAYQDYLRDKENENALKTYTESGTIQNSEVETELEIESETEVETIQNPESETEIESENKPEVEIVTKNIVIPENIFIPRFSVNTFIQVRDDAEPNPKYDDRTFKVIRVRSKFKQYICVAVRNGIVTKQKYKIPFWAEDRYEPIPDPTYIKYEAGQKVLARKTIIISGKEYLLEWNLVIFSHVKEILGNVKYIASGMIWDEIMPFNKKTKHLLGTTNTE